MNGEPLRSKTSTAFHYKTGVTQSVDVKAQVLHLLGYIAYHKKEEDSRVDFVELQWLL